MRRNGTIVIDWALQLAAFLAVLFVLHAGVAHGAMPAERAIIAESLRAGLSPSLALAVAAVRPRSPQWRSPAKIRAEIQALRQAVVRFPKQLDRALRHYGGDDRFVAAVRGWQHRFDAEARATAQAIAATADRPHLDDFADSGLAVRARRAGRLLDDFSPGRG
ncbi:MAG: hypothetical protein OXT06_27090 [Rhodospirillaceae bacterium]|nr:hypothetical protein [Rhodospirillaceae bacterium]MDD9917099.1 hypothetical protein [Rhodospirillaceae bacterium]MDD9926851.1 hypothetical protein [Rhodospirillaceae bacterium]